MQQETIAKDLDKASARWAALNHWIKEAVIKRMVEEFAHWERLPVPIGSRGL